MKLWAAAAVICLLSASHAAPAADSGREDRVVLPAGVEPLNYELSIVPDVAHMRFTGTVKIDIVVARPTRQIALNAADLSFSRVTLSDARQAPSAAFDQDRQTATLSFADPVATGPHTLTIEYSGKINGNAAGLFALEYQAASGKKRALFTQFENSDARRFLPCWDEPAHKASFTLTATVPEAEMAVSNMPVASTEPLPGGLKRVRFARSPKMSSYLLFFASGDFERVSRKVQDTDVGVVVARGNLSKAQFALDAAAELLPYYADYFGARYPLPKLDLIAAPGSSQFFVAMENWGAIFFFEADLLIEPRISTQSDSRLVYEVVAHEMAHQWFGDLVTMRWWDDLWLNESFASWMENKATGHFHPEWKLELEALDSKERAMAIDARRGTHPIVQPIRDVLQANEAFDDITYKKGAAVIRMLEAYVGEDAFRAGVRRYIHAHAYANSVTEDLWRELDATSSINVSQIARDFTLQAGVPLIRSEPQTGAIRLRQERFVADESGKQSARWHVPVTARWLDGRPDWHGIVTGGDGTSIAAAASGGILVNAGQAGYFRTLYAPSVLDPLIAGFATLSAADELGLLYDIQALGYSGYAPLSEFLQIADRMTPGIDPLVLKALAQQLADLDSLYDDLPGQARYRAFCRHVLKPVFATVGWTSRPEDGQNLELLRADLLRTLSRCADPGVIEGARSRFVDFLKAPDSLSGDLRGEVLAVVAEHADAATWDELHKLAAATDSSLEKEQLYRLLGSVQDRALAARSLELSLTDEAPATLRPDLIMQVAKNHHPDLAFDFALAHVDQVLALLEPDSRSEFIPMLAENSKNIDTVAKLKAFAAAYIPRHARNDALMAESAIAYQAGIRSMRLPEIDRWLAAAHFAD